MRIHELEITGLGPYAGTEKIEFDGLNEAGVLLLSGPTGSGKTTILDAVCFAIYGEIPRATKGSEIVSHHRSLETVPEAVLDFTVAGSRLRVTRRPEYVRANMRNPGELTEQKQFVRLERFRDGSWEEDSTGWTEANGRLRDLVGMNADQFHQLVLLPQGKFARFLEAGASDRKDLLETLFPGNDLTYVEDWLKDRARKDAEVRNEMLKQISDRLEQARPNFDALTAELEEDAEALPDFPAHDEPAPVIEWTGAVSAKLSKMTAAATKARKKSQKAWADSDQSLTAAIKKRDQVKQRGEAEDRVKALEAKADWRTELASRIDAADRAATAAPLIRQSRTQAQEAESQAERSGKLAAELRSPDSAGTDEEPALEKLRVTSGKDVAAIENFEREGLERRRELDRLVGTNESELDELEKGGAGTELARCDAALSEARKARDTAREELIEIRRRRTAGMAAELAAGLEEGLPCPVCGSTEHPGADHADTPPVDEEEESLAAERDGESELALTAATQARDAASAESRSQVAKLKDEIERFERERKGLLEKEGKLAAGEATPSARRERLEALSEQIEAFLRSVRKAADTRTAADEALKSAEAEASSRGFADPGEAEAAWVEPEALARSRAELASHDEVLNRAKGLLGGELREIDRDEKVDLVPLEQAAAEAAEIRDRDIETDATATERQQTFDGVTDAIPELFVELKPLRDAASSSANLSRLASGDNERRMKLSIYVLAVRLKQVIQAANRHLRRMSDDRYELVYSGDVAAHGATSGLGIRVFDSHTSESRSTGTFSGGESFFASLSLALGLAEVVQEESGGKPLETLFIDEGFGTLDSKKLEQVMDVIDELREGGRTVGLVSHVDELRNRVTARIEVSADKAGSTVQVVGV